MKKSALILATVFGINLIPTVGNADDQVKSILVDMTHTQRWNRFADKVQELHQKNVAAHEMRTTEEFGGYFNMPKFYKDVKYFDKKTDLLLSRVQWEVKKPDLVHNMEVYFYDKKGRVVRDFGVAYLTDGRAAPMLTTVNFHAYADKLHAFRQFDASNNRTFERCEGSYRGKEVYISLSEMDILEIEDLPKSVMTSSQYKRCFSKLPKTAGKYLTPQ